jgi:hypothetical protein
MDLTPTNEPAKCELCGEPMPPGEEMFNYHGYSGPCPAPPLQRIGRELTPEERTIQHLTENAEVRDRAAFNHWHATHYSHYPERVAAEFWRTQMTNEARGKYADEMMAELRAYHAMSPAERALYNRGERKKLLDRNDNEAHQGPHQEGVST